MKWAVGPDAVRGRRAGQAVVLGVMPLSKKSLAAMGRGGQSILTW